MKNSIYVNYLLLAFLLVVVAACNDEVDVLEEYDALEEEIATVELTAGAADFSKTVSIGASFTAGFTDNALFIAGQQNSFPKMLNDQFAKVGGGDFVQPLTSDNFGGLAAGGSRIANPRLVFDGSGPVGLESLIGPVTVSTDIVLNNPTGPFNNMGVPGALSFHLVTPGYGDLNGVGTYANPYFVRMASSATATVLGDAVAQNPTFFTASLIGANDVLGYAIGGGAAEDQTGNLDPATYGSGDITDPNVFAATYSNIIGALSSNGAKGVVTNIPNITSLPYFTTVPYAPLNPADASFGPLIPTLNSVFGGINQVYDGIKAISDATTVAFLEIDSRYISFSQTAANPVVIKDESLVDLSAEITGALATSEAFSLFVQSLGLPVEAVPLVAGLMGSYYGQARPATADDLLVLPSSSVIGTTNTDSFAFLMGQGLTQELAGQFSAEGITYPLDDQWVLTPEEQQAVMTATDAYNTTIKAVADASADIAFVDLKSILETLATEGITFGDYTMTANLVVGGAVSLDGVHLTARGYSYMAYEFLKAIDAQFGSNFIASGNVPNPGDYPTNYSPTLQ